MGMKKSYKKLAVASAVAMVAGFAANAQAIVDMDNGTGSINFAIESTVLATGTAIDTTATTVLEADATFGFSIGDGTSKYVRYDFVNTRFAADALVTDFALTVAGGGTSSVAISSGGTVGEDYVIVEVSATGSNIVQTDTIKFQPAAGTMEVTNQSTASIAYAIYEFAAWANSQSNSLANRASTYFSWAPGYTAACTAGSPAKIDVVNPIAFVGGAANTPLFSMSTTPVTGVHLLTGVQVVMDDYMGPATDYSIDGAFAAFDQGTAGVFFDANASGAYDVADAIFTVAVDDASATALTGLVPLTDLLFADLATASNVIVTPNTTDEMVPGTYSVTITPTAGANFTLNPISLGTCGALQYSGSTDRMDFALTPNGAYSNFIRVTNPSSTGGDVVMTVWNDAGDQVSFGLSALSGISTDTVAAKASTILVNVNDVYAACQAADGTFDATGSKLRIQVRGEFGDDATEAAGQTMGNTRTAEGIIIQGLTQSRDANSFFMMKN